MDGNAAHYTANKSILLNLKTQKKGEKKGKKKSKKSSFSIWIKVLSFRFPDNIQTSCLL